MPIIQQKLPNKLENVVEENFTSEQEDFPDINMCSNSMILNLSDDKDLKTRNT